jgi:hypothetical protein
MKTTFNLVLTLVGVAGLAGTLGLMELAVNHHSVPLTVVAGVMVGLNAMMVVGSAFHAANGTLDAVAELIVAGLERAGLVRAK